MKRIFLMFALLGLLFNANATSRGPIQPEYASYESVDNSDMVNLLTGDFTYTIPLINVPGPNGGYSMALSYHGGIELEEESSWVGLGWSLNPGAINRSVNQYPDDYKGEYLEHTSQSPGGYGYSVNWGIYSKYYDSNVGKGGRAGLGSILSVGFGNDAGLTVIGVSYNSNTGKVNADPVEIATSLTTIAITVATAPTGAGLAYIASSVALTAGSEVVGAMISNGAVGKDWDGNITNESLVQHKWRSGFMNSRMNYFYYYKGARTDRMYGSLYLGELEPDNRLASSSQPHDPKVKNQSGSSSYSIKRINSGAVSDVSYNADGSYKSDLSAVSIAYDNYSVVAPGVSGAISPYRMDMGSVAFNPTETGAVGELDDNVSYSIKEWLHRNSDQSTYSNLPYEYKTGFRYKSEITNGYDYHTRGISNFDAQDNFSLDKTTSSFSQSPITNGYHVNYILGSDYLYDKTKFIENRTNNTLFDGQLAHGKQIQYFTNKELENYTTNDVTTTTVYKDHLSGLDRYYDRVVRPDYGIGGFVITNSDGVSYHFTIPVYQSTRWFYSGLSSSSYYNNRNSGKTAVTWLLTGITGSDYIDRGTQGVIDEADWGYWVKLDYGKFSNNYIFRSPYKDWKKNRSLEDNVEKESFRTSFESYYLNSIQTASHTAFFLKSLKEDGRSAYWQRANFSWNDEPSSTLKLDEVVIVPNSFAKHLTTPTGNGGLGLDYSDSDPYDNNNLENNDTYTNVLDNFDLNSTQISAIRSNQVRRIVFNTNYELCSGTFNSYTSAVNPPTDGLGNGGKLTLNSFSVYGQGDVKLSPDYVFDYNASNSDDNPDYGEHDYDGWGFYSQRAIDNVWSHQATEEGDEWSLKSITTPLGSEILIDYERDNYSSLSGIGLKYDMYINQLGLTITGNTLRVGVITNIDMRTILSAGDVISISDLRVLRKQNLIGFGENLSGNQTVTNVGQYFFELDLGPPPAGYNWINAFFTTPKPYVQFDVDEKIGGDVRVASISVKDEDANISTTKYVYTWDGQETGRSSGVATMEPELIHQDIDISRYRQYKYYDFPGPKVMYGKVTVLSNYKTSTDFLSKEVYEFVTPDVGMIDVDVYAHSTSATSNWDTDYDFGAGNIARYQTYGNKLNMAAVNVTVNTSQIGTLKKQTSYSKTGNAYKTIAYSYFNDEDIDFSQDLIGVYTEGSLLTEKLFENGDTYHKNIQTLKTFNPTKLSSYTITESTHSKTVANKTWDYITGKVLETEYEDAYGKVYRTEDVPAYTVYPEMGHILENTSNKHMLTQTAANYLKVEDRLNPGSWVNLSANTTVFSNNWVYREFDDVAGKWTWVSGPSNDAWRQKESYAWRALANSDGSFISETSTVDDFVPFDWANPTANSNWIKASTIEHYTHASAIVEEKSSRNIYATTKVSNNDLYGILSANNANYVEAIYTGIEGEADNRGGIYYFDKEIICGAGTAIETAPANVHTGKQSLKVSQGQFGLVYRIHDYSQNLNVNRDYQMSVWVKNASGNSIPSAAQCYIQYRSGGQAPAGSILQQNSIYLNATNSQKAGDWYLFTVDIPKYTGGSTVDFLEIQLNCAGTSGDQVYFDDYRFYPLTASITTSVYDYDNGWETAILNNMNMAARSTYDASGRVIKTEVEVLDSEANNGVGGFRTQSERKYNYGKDL